MAIELGKVNVTDLSQNNYKILGLGINRNSDSNGIFAVNYTTLTQAKDNLRNLILTKKGERVQQPEFGCDIWLLVFEQIDEENLENRIESSILDAVQSWIPNININQIIFDYDNNDIDNNRIALDIKFSLISNPNLTERIQINVNN